MKDEALTIPYHYTHVYQLPAFIKIFSRTFEQSSFSRNRKNAIPRYIFSYPICLLPISETSTSLEKDENNKFILRHFYNFRTLHCMVDMVRNYLNLMEQSRSCEFSFDIRKFDLSSFKFQIYLARSIKV